jgi:hypothetical protein
MCTVFMHKLILQQYKSGKSLSLPKYAVLRNHLNNNNVNDHYKPVGNSYYHDFNPNFTFNIKDERFLKFTPTLTLRDGLLTFGRFILRHQKLIPKMKVHFLIHPDLAAFVPVKLKNQFSTWQLSQQKKIEFHDANKIIIFAIAHESYLNSLDHVRLQLNNLKKIPDHIQIEVCLPMRKDVFDVTEIDSIFLHKAMILIQETFPGKSVTIIRPSDLISRADFRGQVLFDLAPDNYFVSDNFMHYLVAGRGGTVNLMPQIKPKDAFFTIPLSLYHKLHLAPLPDIESRFESLLIYSRVSKHINPLCDPVFQNIMRGIL